MEEATGKRERQLLDYFIFRFYTIWIAFVYNIYLCYISSYIFYTEEMISKKEK